MLLQCILTQYAKKKIKNWLLFRNATLTNRRSRRQGSHPKGSHLGLRCSTGGRVFLLQVVDQKTLPKKRCSPLFDGIEQLLQANFISLGLQWLQLQVLPTADDEFRKGAALSFANRRLHLRFIRFWDDYGLLAKWCVMDKLSIFYVTVEYFRIL